MLRADRQFDQEATEAERHSLSADP
jgi:hypothetical protein